MFFLYRHSDSVHRSRMTAGVSIFRKAVSDFSLNKRKDPNHEPSPNTGKVAALAVGRGKCEQKRKTVSYKTALHTCLSFLNEVKNLARDTGIKSSVLCTQTCPYRLAGSALPGQRRSVSLRFRVAMLLKTQFACHRFRGKRTLRGKDFLYRQPCLFIGQSFLFEKIYLFLTK